MCGFGGGRLSRRPPKCVTPVPPPVQDRRLARYAELKAGESIPCGEMIELKWNAFLGFPALDKKSKVAMAKGKVGWGRVGSGEIRMRMWMRDGEELRRRWRRDRWRSWKVVGVRVSAMGFGQDVACMPNAPTPATHTSLRGVGMVAGFNAAAARH